MADSNSKVAFIVVCWNNRDIIDECLSALQAQTYASTDIYLIDNASADGTVEYIKSTYGDRIKLTASDKNHGFAKGNNILIQKALEDPSVKYLALVNSDAVLDKNWTQNLVDYVHDKPRFGAAQGITLDYYNHNKIDAAHIYVRKDLQSVQFGYLDSFRSFYDYPRRVFGVNAAAAMYSRSFIEEQRGKKLFDEKFFMYLEDVDVSFRALVTGWQNYYVPSAKAYHMGSASSKKKSSTFNIQWTIRNQAALMFKNMPIRTFLVFLPSALRFERKFYDHVERNYGKADAKLVLKNRIIGILRLPLYIGDRWWVYRHRKMNSKELERIIKQDGIV